MVKQHKTRVLYHRPIQPRLNHPKALTIHHLSITYTGGKTLVKIHPSQICIGAKELITMVEEKHDYMTTSNGSCIRREDLLLAAEALLQNQTTDLDKQRTGHSYSKSSKPGPKRPSNAFMLYSSSLRKRIKTLFPEFNNSDVSKLLGAMWRSASNEVKEKYTKKANEQRMWHKEQFPDFEYNARKMPSSTPPPSSTLDHSNADHLLSHDYGWIPSIDSIECPPLPVPSALPPSHPSTTQSAYVSRDPTETNGLSEGYGPSYLDFNFNEFYPSFNLCDDGMRSPLPPPGSQPLYSSTDGWQEMCNSVASMFPECSDTNLLLDEDLWSSLQDLGVMDDAWEMGAMVTNHP
ncbi:uncharacterized protein BYT42DRAFT_586643 [Radiomyces spectabilis]|uniref:uncharacterized protein n=1 Tax=Radiomyces spectabilis TaxID=64574 RepID=UPI00221FD047|nr:uncharacterized protein BYT42DRAFT_586643 [Radiomyces spectabilis]KAI8367540.1 hypothetical protein BYT42DRAFT_586643 [Radiomyces spectabilis]